LVIWQDTENLRLAQLHCKLRTLNSELFCMSSNVLIIRESDGKTKLQSLIDSINEAIATESLKPGDTLPSVNEMSRYSGFSRDTVVKAYNILKQQSVIESTPAKGFYISSSSQRVFMLLDDFSAFKEQLYRAFRSNLPQKYSVDLLFHHYNTKVFEQLISQAIGRYSMYVVMNINNKKLHPVLSKIDPDRLLVLDMGDETDIRNNYLLQNFEVAVTTCLTQSLDLLLNYKEFVFIYSKQKTPHPPETEGALRNFCKLYGLGFHVMSEIHFECMIAGQIYFVITESDLVQALKSCREKGLSLGSEIGIIAFNDTPMKEIAGNGITVISVDFNEMGKKAAAFVKSKQKVSEVISTRLIVRGSL
jgi:DNA-binding transcriptional regulator YhcF (GntR family)